MNITHALSGGSPRELGKADDVAAYVLQNPKKLDELYKCLFDDDEIVRMRAADALEKVCRERPDLLSGYVDRLLFEVARIDQPSVQWHLAQMLGEVKLNTTQKGKAIALLKKNLGTASDWIALNNTLESFAVFARQDPKLCDYFIKQLRRYEKSELKSVAKRASKLLQQFS